MSLQSQPFQDDQWITAFRAAQHAGVENAGEAVTFYTQALTHAPHTSFVTDALAYTYFGRTKASFAAGQRTQALSDLEESFRWVEQLTNQDTFLALVVEAIGLAIRENVCPMAEPIARRALSRSKQSDRQVMTLILLDQLAHVRLHQEASAEAERLFHDGMRLAESLIDPPLHPTRFINGRATALLALQATDQVEALLLSALASYRNRCPIEEWHALHHNLAANYALRSQHGQASVMTRNLIHDIELQFGPHHPSLVLPLSNLAVFSCQNKAIQEAVPLLERAIQISQLHGAKPAQGHAKLLISLGDVYLFTQDCITAEGLYRRALVLQDEVLPLPHPDRVSTLVRLAIALMNQQDLMNARLLFEDAVHLLNSEPILYPDLLLPALHSYIHTLEMTGTPAETERWRQRCHELTQRFPQSSFEQFNVDFM